MKRILITGANSYIGTSFENWIQQFNKDYQVDTIDMHGNSWEDSDFSIYDSIFHVAGIAHADVSKVSEETKKLYYEINCDLAVRTAEKYKTDLNGKSGQFIYMSSIIVYGIESNILKKRVITKDTVPKPQNFYGDSKLKAEEELKLIANNNLKLLILRPPMIYGPNSKGNYKQLVKLSKFLPIFPNIKNERSVLHIYNLCKFVKQKIDEKAEGVLFPQNDNYSRTSFMVREIALENGKKIYLTSSFNWLIYLLGYTPGKIGKVINKAFGSLVYEKSE